MTEIIWNKKIFNIIQDDHYLFILATYYIHAAKKSGYYTGGPSINEGGAGGVGPLCDGE